MAKRTIDITIGGKDRLSGVLGALTGKLRDFSKASVAAISESISAFKTRALAVRDSLAMETDAFARMHKSALSTYETLDEINKRIDAPKEAARYQEEHNKALERYNQLLKEAADRQKSVYAKKHFFNAFDPSTAKNLAALHGEGNAAAPSLMDGLKKMTLAARRAWPALLMVNKAMGEGQGPAAKLGQSLMGIAGMFMAFGPAGAIIGGAQAGIDALVGHFKKKADEMVDRAKKMAAKTAEALAFTKDQQLGVYRGRTEYAAERADSRTKAAEYAAKKEAESAAARQRAESAGASVEMQRMKNLAAQDIAAASDADKERVRAAWNYKIAEKEAEIKERSAEQAKADENAALAAAEQKLAITERNIKELDAEAVRAANKAQQIQDAFGETDKAYAKEFQDVADAAMARSKAEHDSARAQKDALEIMRKDIKANDDEREASRLESARSVAEAEMSYIQAEENREKEYVRQIAEQRRQEEERLHKQRLENLKAESDKQKQMENGLKSVAAAAQSEFDRAFAAYRDPDKAFSQIAEDRDYAADLKRLHRDARRYGGKWRIDELARLMAVGDTQGVSDTLEGWRKSSRFSPEIEAMVRASAAEKTKTTVEDELRKIESNTADLAAKLDELISMKG